MTTVEKSKHFSGQIQNCLWYIFKSTCLNISHGLLFCFSRESKTNHYLSERLPLHGLLPNLAFSSQARLIHYKQNFIILCITQLLAKRRGGKKCNYCGFPPQPLPQNTCMSMHLFLFCSSHLHPQTCPSLPAPLCALHCPIYVSFDPFFKSGLQDSF